MKKCKDLTGWFGFFNDTLVFEGYLILKPSMYKNISGTIQKRADLG